MKPLQEMLDTLFGQLRKENPHLSQAQFDNVKKHVNERIRKEPPPQIAFIGDAGVGKSSTLNALFNAGQEVGHEKATTQIEAGIKVTTETVQGEKGSLLVYDMPGLGESMAKRDIHLATYERILSKVDVALWILDAQFRALEYTQRALKDEIARINPDLVNRMVFALNKVDLVHPGETAWHPLANLPSPEQQMHIQGRIADVKRLVLEALPEWHGTVIGYSATKRYNLPQLFAVMLDAVAKKRQWVLSDRMSLADFYEFVHPSLLPEDKRSVQVNKRPAQANSTRQMAQEALGQMSEEQVQAFLAEWQHQQDNNKGEKSNESNDDQ